MDELRAVKKASKPDILCTVETWLDEDVADSELVLDNFHCSGRGGGACAYCALP